MATLQQTKTGQFLLTLPRPIVQALVWQKGQAIKIEIAGKGKLVLSGE